MLQSLVGMQIGKYLIQEVIGQGGMGVVYRATDTLLEREVAFKTIRTDFLEGKSEEERLNFIHRFQREAKNLARHEHNNILEIYDFSGADSELLYIVTRLIRGYDLGKLLVESPTFTRIYLCVISQICNALIYIHEEGIVHRDLKPANIMVELTGRAVLMDFGLSKDTHSSSRITNNQILGTLDYMAPEQLLDQDVSAVTDVFALGVILYELTTGKLPFEGKLYGKIQSIIQGNFQPPRAFLPTLDERIERIIMQCLKINPAERFPDIQSVKIKLDELLAELNLSDDPKEISAFLKNPSVFNEQFKRFLFEAGKTFQQNGNLAASFACFGEILTMDPEFEEIPQFLNQSGVSLPYDLDALQKMDRPFAVKRNSPLYDEATATVADVQPQPPTEKMSQIPKRTTEPEFFSKSEGKSLKGAGKSPHIQYRRKTFLLVLLAFLLGIVSMMTWVLYKQDQPLKPQNVPATEQIVTNPSVDPSHSLSSKQSVEKATPDTPVETLSPPESDPKRSTSKSTIPMEETSGQSAKKNAQTAGKNLGEKPAKTDQQKPQKTTGIDPSEKSLPRVSKTEPPQVTPQKSDSAPPQIGFLKIVGLIRAKIEINGNAFETSRLTKPQVFSAGDYPIQIFFPEKPIVTRRVTIIKDQTTVLDMDRIYKDTFGAK